MVLGNGVVIAKVVGDDESKVKEVRDHEHVKT